VLDAAGNLYDVEGLPGPAPVTKRDASAALLWQAATTNYQRVVGPDEFGGVITASDDGTLSRYDRDGNLIWIRTLPPPPDNYCQKLVADGNGNRFLQLARGCCAGFDMVARLGAELSGYAPSIVAPPVGTTLFAGSNYIFTVLAAGSAPRSYSWLFNGTPLPGETNTTLDFTNLNSTQSGNYAIIISNSVNSITSAPIVLRVKSVQFFLGNQMLTNGTYYFLAPPTLSVLSVLGGPIFYTSDGSAPSPASTPYTGSFLVTTSATFRAIGYSSGFSQSEEADSVTIVPPPLYSLSLNSTVGGTTAAQPAGDSYYSNTVVTITAVPTNGWLFLYWQGDVTGSSPSINITMNTNKTVQAVFGTTLGTVVTGSGQVLLSPPDGPYPDASVVRLTAVPQVGNYLAAWGSAASGNANPLYFTINSPTQTVSSTFLPTPDGQAGLTVVVIGHGQVLVDPQANVYPTNASVTLTAKADTAESFLHWGGDASGTVNPLTLDMTQPRFVVANFSGGFRLYPLGLLPSGFQLTVGEPFGAYQLYGSTTLASWVGLGIVSNSALLSPFTDAGATNAPKKFYRAAQQ
jgi:hypothetical protein